MAWEGDPGFSAAEPWKTGFESYLETPLRELIERRKIDELRPWIAAWAQTGLPALGQGDVPAALGLLQKAREFERGILPEVRDAWRRLEALQGALDELERTTEAIAAEGRQPALVVLLEWAEAAAIEPERKARASALREAKAGEAKAWERALKQLDSRRARIAREPALLGELVESLRQLEGAFPAELADLLEAAGDDPQALESAMDSAAGLPQRWLARGYFNW